MKPTLILKKIMRDNCIRQGDIAERLGISQQLLSDKIRRNMRVELFVSILNVLGFKVICVDKDGRGYEVTI